MDAFSKIIGIILAIIVAIPAVLFWGFIIYLCFFNSSKNTSKKQEPNQAPPANKTPPSAQLQTKTLPLKDIDFQQIVKSPSFDGAREQISRIYKEKQKEEEQRSKITLIAVGVSLFVFFVILIGIALS
jgi:flagellar basal body-associated protein FliL